MPLRPEFYLFGACTNPMSQSGEKSCLLFKIPNGIFNQDALQNEPHPSTMNGADRIW
jgi:hypothetical protein